MTEAKGPRPQRKVSSASTELAAELRRIQAETTAVQAERQREIDARLAAYLEDVPESEETTAVRKLRELIKPLGIESDLVPTTTPPEGALTQPVPPSVPTRPSPEALVDTRAEPSWGVAEAGVPDAPTSRPVVLVVDDDVDLLATVSEILTAEGYRVETATDGAEGFWKLWASPRTDLVLLDLSMPKHDALDFFRALDRSPLLGVVPVVIISGGKPPQDAIDYGCVYLRKPLDLPRLLETVRFNIDMSRRRRAKE